MPESRTSPRRIEAYEKQRQALALRMAGATFEVIATTLGYASRQGAHMAVEAALHKTIQEPADQLRKLDVERLDALLLAVWQPAKAGSLPHIAAALTILARKAKLLGLDVALPVPGSTKDKPLYIQDVGPVDLSNASDAELDEIIRIGSKAAAIREAETIVKEPNHADGKLDSITVSEPEPE